MGMRFSQRCILFNLTSMLYLKSIAEGVYVVVNIVNKTSSRLIFMTSLSVVRGNSIANLGLKCDHVDF